MDGRQIVFCKVKDILLIMSVVVLDSFVLFFLEAN